MENILRVLNKEIIIIMRKNHLTKLAKKLSILSFGAFLIANILNPFCLVSQAAGSDDPGAGRLSGEDIPKEFFEDGRTGLDDNNFSFTPFNLFGSSQTVSAYTKTTYTHQDKFDGLTIVNGIDVSEYQNGKPIDWAQVKASGIEFAFIRVGARGYGSAGKMINDTYYAQNVDGAIAAGLNVGLYVYSQATTEAEAVEEAQFILDKIGDRNINLPLVLDYEFAAPATSKLRAAKLSKDAATAVCLAFCEKIQETQKYTPMVYANPDMLNNHLNADVISGYYPIWLANYTTSTTYPGAFQYWQYSSSGTVPGITSKVDMNFYYVPAANDIFNTIVTPIPDQTYTGAAITPELTVSIDGKTLVGGTDYTVAYSNNTAPGTANITITGINGYSGSKNIVFKIVDSTPIPVINDLSASAKAKNYITLKWSAAANVTGYELYRSNSFNGEYTLVTTISNSNTSSFKNTGLAEGQCYNYKIRAYRTVNGNTSYGDFSGVVQLYTKTSYTKLILPTSNTVIYAEMDINSEVIQNVKKNAFVKATFAIYDDAGSKWYRTSYGSVAGYIPASKVKVCKQGKVNTSKVNVRQSSKVTSKRVTTVGKNKKVAILKTKKTKSGTWSNIQFTKGSKTYKGWIYSIYIKI